MYQGNPSKDERNPFVEFPVGMLTSNEVDPLYIPAFTFPSEF